MKKLNLVKIGSMKISIDCMGKLKNAQKIITLSIILCTITDANCQVPGIQRIDTLNAENLLNTMMVKDVDVLILGEELHQDGGALKINQELILVLNEKYGFNNFIIESDFFSLYQYTNCGDCKIIPENNIYKGWSNAQEFAPILELAENKKITIYGFDSRHHGEYSKEYLLEIFDRNWNSDIFNQNEKDLFFTISKSILLTEFDDTTSSEKATLYIDIMDRWINSITDTSSFFHHELQNFKGLANQVWIEKKSPDKYIELREYNMISNINYLLNNTLKNQKVIILGANLHVEPGITKLSHHASLNVGDYIKQNFKSISFIPINYTGTRRSYDGIHKVTKPQKGTIARKLSQEKMNFALINLNLLPKNSKIYVENESNPTVYGDYLIYIRKTQPTILINE